MTALDPRPQVSTLYHVCPYCRERNPVECDLSDYPFPETCGHCDRVYRVWVCIQYNTEPTECEDFTWP